LRDAPAALNPFSPSALCAMSWTTTSFFETNPYFEKVAREQGFYSPEIMDAVARSGSIRHMEGIPQEVKRVFVTAHDITPEWHIRMQAAFQEFTDNAVSKTVNLPRDATVEDVMKVYNLSYELGCKGVTIYRDGSRENQVLRVDEKGKELQALARRCAGSPGNS
jgi:ribonucleoside-diphosphate reductase alpha chain